jgi:hypothetical protein
VVSSVKLSDKIPMTSYDRSDKLEWIISYLTTGFKPRGCITSNEVGW